MPHKFLYVVSSQMYNPGPIKTGMTAVYPREGADCGTYPHLIDTVWTRDLHAKSIQMLSCVHATL